MCARMHTVSLHLSLSSVSLACLLPDALSSLSVCLSVSSSSPRFRDAVDPSSVSSSALPSASFFHFSLNLHTVPFSLNSERCSSSELWRREISRAVVNFVRKSIQDLRRARTDLEESVGGHVKERDSAVALLGVLLALLQANLGGQCALLEDAAARAGRGGRVKLTIDHNLSTLIVGMWCGFFL